MALHQKNHLKKCILEVRRVFCSTLKMTASLKQAKTKNPRPRTLTKTKKNHFKKCIQEVTGKHLTTQKSEKVHCNSKHEMPITTTENNPKY